MKRILIGLIGGILGAIVNVAFLFFAPDLKFEVYLSTAITWIVIGILISVCDFKINGSLKGIVVSLLVSASSLVYTMASSLSGAIWTVVNILLVGAVMGYGIDQLAKKLNR